MTTQNPTMTLADFLALVNDNSVWTREQERFNEEETDRSFYQDDEDDYHEVTVPVMTGGVALFSSTVLPTGEKVEIIYPRAYEYDMYDPDETFEDFAIETEPTISIIGLTVVEIDEEGDATEVDMNVIVDELPAPFFGIDWSFIPDNPITDVDTDKNSDKDTDMETITLKIDNAPDIRFVGEKIAGTSSSDDKAYHGNYSGQTGRWTTLRLYRTAGGKFVCHQIGHTRWQGEQTRYSGAVCDDEAGVLKFFGFGWLAKDLYDEAGIDYATDVA